MAVPPVEGLFAAQGPIIGDPDTLWMASIAGYNPARSELVAYDTKDLRLLSRLPLDGFVPHRASMALASDGTVYVGTALEGAGGRLYATNATTGFYRAWNLPRPVVTAPVLRGDSVVLVAAEYILQAMSPDGTVLWTFETKPLQGEPRMPITAGPILDADGNIYLGDLSGELYALTPDGKERWPSLDLGYRIDASPAIGPANVLYVLAEGEGPAGQGQLVHALDLQRQGASKWTTPFQLPSALGYSSPVIGADGRIYFGGGEKFYAVADDGTQGQLEWSFDVEGNVISSPLLAPDGMLYFGSGYGGDPGRFYALQASGPSAESPWPMFRHDLRRTANAASANSPPTIALTSPSTGSTYVSPASVTLTATASDRDGSITRVQFFVGATLLETLTNSPYSVQLNLPTPGDYVLMARATDNLGAKADSTPVTISVQPERPLNDNFAEPTVLSGVNIGVNGSNLRGTKEASEPSPPGELGGKSVLWSWPGPRSGPAFREGDHQALRRLEPEGRAVPVLEGEVPSVARGQLDADVDRARRERRRADHEHEHGGWPLRARGHRAGGHQGQQVDRGRPHHPPLPASSVMRRSRSTRFRMASPKPGAGVAERSPSSASRRRRDSSSWRARRSGIPVALVLEAAARDGYSGRIGLILAVAADGKLLAVRVTAHKETPGLGDYIDPKKDRNKKRPWITQFNDLGFDSVPRDKWRVKKDGGRFDQMSGATISARAVTNASGRALAWTLEHRDKLFALPANSRFEEKKQ